MKERPILFSGPMVRAILDGRKTQTRRLCKVPAGYTMGERDDGSPWPYYVADISDDERGAWLPCPHGAPGDRLWVRETFALAPLRTEPDPDDHDDWYPIYRADGDERPWLSSLDDDASEVKPPWKPSIFMPRWASRILLEITEVRVQPLQDLTEADAKAEGVKPFGEAFAGISLDQRIASTTLADRERGAPDRDFRAGDSPYRASFACLWDEINGDRATWASNPWVWAIAFRRVDATRSA